MGWGLDGMKVEKEVTSHFLKAASIAVAIAHDHQTPASSAFQHGLMTATFQGAPRSSASDWTA
jgi:hypothetical protein